MFPIVGTCIVAVALGGPARTPAQAEAEAEARARDVEREVARIFAEYEELTARVREGNARSKALLERVDAYDKARAAEKAAREKREAERKAPRKL